MEALQEAISVAQDQRTARDAYATLRRRAGVPPPKAVVRHVMWQLFVAAIVAIPKEEAVLDEEEPIVMTAPRVVRLLVNRAPRSRQGSHALHEALVQAKVAGS